MILAQKVRILPTKEQETRLWKSAGTARFVYNWALAKQQENYQQGGKFIKHTVLRKEFTKMKQVPEYVWLYDVSNNVAKQAIKDLCIAYFNFFKGLADKPRFKSRRHSKPSFYHDPVKLKVKENVVRIEKIGWVQTAEQLPSDVKYTNPRLSFDGKYWYIAVGLKQIVPKQALTDESIGIDVGVKELAVCSNGKRIKNINKTKTVRQVEKRLRMLQRQVSRKYKMNKEGDRFVKTSNIIKLERKIRHLHRRLTNIRTNHIHQATNDIVKAKPYRIVMETLNIKGMMKNKHLSKAIGQQKLYDFKMKLQYKCEKYEIAFIEADKWFPSSKICSRCGEIKKDLKLSDRVYRCICGHEIDRDLNASINLSRYELAM